MEWYTDFCVADFFDKMRGQAMREVEASCRSVGAPIPKSDQERTKFFFRWLLIRITQTASDQSAKFDGETQTLMLTDKSGEEVSKMYADYIWMRTGRPRWFIDKEMCGLLSDVKVDDDLSGIRWPYDVFHLVFERGTEILGCPLRFIRIVRIHSDMSLKILREISDFSPERDAALMEKYAIPQGKRCSTTNAILFEIDFGENGYTGVFSPDTAPEQTVTSYLWRRVEFPPTEQDSIKLSKIETQRVEIACKIAISAALYWAARPEFVSEYSIPRNSRYQFKERKECRRVMLPTEKYVRSFASDGDGLGGGSVKPHFRGWVLRSLRAERYHRDEDGSIRVILVPPCAIHPELMEAKS